MKLIFTCFLILFVGAPLAVAEAPATAKTIVVIIIGEVKKPGEYLVAEGSTIWHVIALAGGREIRGWGPGKIRLTRKTKDGGLMTYAFEEGKKEQNREAAILQENDLIVVPTIL